MKNRTISRLWHVTYCVIVIGAPVAFAQAPTTTEGVSEYRTMLADDNPAELWESRGEELWRLPQGPKSVPLSKCDLGLGPGVIKGAYARLPRYFADTNRVQDLESRLVSCMVKLQGLNQVELLKTRFGGATKSDLEAITAYLASASRGEKVKISLSHAKEKEAFEVGKAIFYYRGGPHDFSCASCHSESGKRIRLQELPNLTNSADAAAAYTAWPAYRVSEGELRTMEWRINDCFRQQRFPELQYGSEAAIALTMFLAKNAEGGVMKAPAIKR